MTGKQEGDQPVLGAVGKESMTYRELSMIDVKELLRRWSAEQSNRQIATDTGADRGTVGRYVDVAKQLGLAHGHEFTEAEVHEIAQRVQAWRAHDPSAEWSAVAQHRERINEWLDRERPLKLTKIHTPTELFAIAASQ